MRKTLRIWLILVLAVLSTGCSSISKAEQPAVVDSIILDESLSLGQTFNAQFDGMDGIEIYLEPLESGDGYLQLQLREDSQIIADIAVASIPIKEISIPGFYRFSLPNQVDSNQQNYYLLLKIKGDGSVKVGYAPGDYFLNGALYQGNQPQDQRQMTFKLSYYFPRLSLGIFEELFTWIYYLLVAFFLFVIPGWAVLSCFGENGKETNNPKNTKTLNALESPFSKLALATGISLSIYPILMVWSDLLGLHLGAIYAWAPPILGSLWLIWALINKWRQERLHLGFPKLRLPDFVLILIILLIIVTRFWAIRSIPIPMWGDSYHHTMIAQLLVNNKGLFESWQPYADVVTFTYHFGFHAAVTSFYWITNIPMFEAVLWVGQIINIFAVIALYPLAIKFFKNPWSGILAILVAGLLSSMPMFYANWGRYTQLAGQVILLVAIWFTWKALKLEKLDWQILGINWVLVSGLALTHYRVIIFYGLFVIAFLFLNLRKESYWLILKKVFGIGLGAGIIFLPRFINVFGGRILHLFQNSITKFPPTTSDAATRITTYSIGDLTTYLPITLWLLLIFVLAVGLWRKNKEIAIVGLWWFFLVLAANPHWLHLPGNGILDNFAIFIAAYIPAGMILASIPEWFYPKPSQFSIKTTRINIALAIFVLGFGIWGTWQRYREVLPHTYALATNPDLRAANWIRENIPSGSNFLVNAFFAYNDRVMVGSDGGWWLPLLAKRQTILPPMTIGFESEPYPGYTAWIQAPTRMIEQHGLAHPETIATLLEHNISHVYIGQQQGSVNYAGPLRLNPIELQNDPHFRAIYHQDRVWVFELVP